MLDKNAKKTGFKKPLNMREKIILQQESKKSINSALEQNILSELNKNFSRAFQASWDVIIIGAGPSGLMAAFQLKKNKPQLRVLLVEAQKRAGLKLLASGGGRCNILNSGSVSALASSYFEAEKFVRNIFKKYDTDDLKNFFTNTGLELSEEALGRVFPVSKTAQSVLEYFLINLKNLNVALLTGYTLTNILPKDNLYHLKIEPNKSNQENEQNSQIFNLSCHHLILACGSATYPHLCGTDSIKNFSEQLALNFIEYTPALSSISLAKDSLLNCPGTVFSDLTLKFKDQKKIIYKTNANFLCTHNGISGPAAQNISHFLYQDKYWQNNNSSALYLDFLTEETKLLFEQKGLYTNLASGLLPAIFSNYNLTKIIADHLPLKAKEGIMNLIQKFFLENSLKKDNYSTLSWQNFTKHELQVLLTLLKDGLPLIPLQKGNFAGRPSLKQAKVGCGGIDLKEVQATTLELKKYKNLYVCGEALNLDGETGGYNIQMAFITASITALTILEKSK